MNKKEDDFDDFNGTKIFIVVIILGVMIYGLIFLYMNISNGITNYRAYSNFCNERPNFCYCSWDDGCVYKTSWSSINGLSNDTKELCELATKLEDKKTIFKVDC